MVVVLRLRKPEVNAVVMRVKTSRSVRTLAILPLLLGVAFLGACGDDDDDDVVAIQAVDYAFEGAPATLSEGTHTFSFENIGGEFHEVILLKLPEGVTVQQALELPEDEADELLFGGAQGVLLAAPGVTAGARLVSDLTPGSYAFICSIPNAEGVPHLALGMVSELTVTE